jgi:hypothetical protein
MGAEMGMKDETHKQADEDDEASEPSAESVESRWFGFGSPPGAGDHTDWVSHHRSILCRSTTASQGIGLLRCQHAAERRSRQLWAFVCVSCAAFRAERQDKIQRLIQVSRECISKQARSKVAPHPCLAGPHMAVQMPNSTASSGLNS